MSMARMNKQQKKYNNYDNRRKGVSLLNLAP